eukprot:254609_1
MAQQQQATAEMKQIWKEFECDLKNIVNLDDNIDVVTYLVENYVKEKAENFNFCVFMEMNKVFEKLKETNDRKEIHQKVIASLRELGVSPPTTSKLMKKMLKSKEPVSFKQFVNYYY